MLKHHLKATWNPDADRWEEPQETIFGHSDAYSETLPTSGMTRNGALYERATSVPPTVESESSSSRGDEAADIPRLPTPLTTDEGGDSPGRRRRDSVQLSSLMCMIREEQQARAGLLPTTTATDAAGSRNATAERRTGASFNAGTTLTDALVPREAAAHLGAVQDAEFGEYALAVTRWEEATGRPAPDPTEISPRGTRRLSARFIEWMMGVPDGWITDTEGVTRREAIKASGNGVVPQQAARALSLMIRESPPF